MSATIGGPVPIRIPVLNRDKKSFNFFYSVEDMRLKDVNQLRMYTMPTALERSGDFSQTRTGGTANRRVGFGARSADRQSVPRQCRFPPARRDPLGVALMNIFPLPNVTAVGLQLPHPGAEHRPSAARAADALRYPPDRQGHDQHQVSELVHQERGLGSRGPLLAVGPGAAALRLHRRPGQGRLDAHLDVRTW